ncbi:alkaline phosphatase D family protein [Iamia majanohamensis]|uniref:Alkaline phosphatase D family protein n=1 Tax=Iamia majanohamensis TaxID=467976 RepID=A0AAE9Y6S4_9ACTN|nr:alkaline phosphatase D family protein [Iamia majanohamensis]WCO65383.1 alkaline phosphatase D family protein [Iamia majanohamensis]
MAELVLGPLLRAVEGDAATVWVATDQPCEVTVTAGRARGRARTTTVGGACYALVVVEDLPPATSTPYAVALDGDPVWPLAGADLPPSTIRTADPGRPLRVVVGSCRVDAPMEAPWDLPPAAADRGQGVDALEALAQRLALVDPVDHPDLLALLGDQLYADEVLVGDIAVRTPGPGGPPPRSAADLADYEDLYRRSWSHPHVRWLLSTVPSVMAFDDHDVIDDWNLSQAWLDEIDRAPWWDARISSALVSYWVHQHWGNLTPSQQADDPLAGAVAGAADATDLLRGEVDGWRLDRAAPTRTRWSTTRDLAGSATARLVGVDSRNRRVLDEGARALLDADEMAWVGERARADRDGIDHLLLGTSLPWLLPPAVHDLERWGAALASGAWGRPGRHLAERLRRDRDLEHWASFGDSFDDLAELLASIASGEQGPAPSSVLVLSGDVHFSYLAPADLGVDGGSRVVQVVSSPLRNGVPTNLQRVLRLTTSRLGAWLGRVGERTAAHREERVDWALSAGPWFGNVVTTLTLDGATASVRVEQARQDHEGRPDLVTVHEERLAGPPTA